MSDDDLIDDVNLDLDDVVVLERKEAKVKPPPMYKVVMFNDDYTPMEFVIHVLMVFFSMELDKAVRIMMTIHTTGQSVVGIYPREIAETKCEQVNNYSQSQNHPLLSTIEMTD